MLDEDQRNVISVDQDRADQRPVDDGALIAVGKRPANQQCCHDVSSFIECPGD
jgi:hypothetical protein